MKKTIVLILITVVVIVSIVFANYVEYNRKKTEITKINNQFTLYKNSLVQIDKVISLMNKAIDLNLQNAISQDENKLFIENDTNSIKVYLEIKSRESIIPMEEFLLNKDIGIEKMSYAFSDLLFETTKIEYHKKTKQVKEIIFTAKEDT